MKIACTERDGYLILNLVPPKSPKNLGIWGERRRRYLCEYKNGI